MMKTTDTPAIAPEQTRTGFTTIDCDFHNHFKKGLHDLKPYLPYTTWHRLSGEHTGQAGQFALPRNNIYINACGLRRRDSFLDDGTEIAADARLSAQYVLDEYKIERAVLLPGNLFGLGAVPDPDLSAAIASAANDWQTEHWTQVDPRYRASLVIAPHDPALAVKEIERAGNRPGVCQIIMPGMNVLMGERHYYPIYEAAAHYGLPVAIHPNAADGIYAKAPNLVGTYTYYVEWHTAACFVFQANMISLICQGVFERFPTLKIVMVEGGFAWVPGLIWRLDKNWQGLRDEVPWVKRSPSSYLFEHFRFTTQPVVEPTRERLHAICDMIHAEQTLMFSSDYPHWDFDNPLRALDDVPEEIRENIRAGNASKLYGARLD